MMHGTTNIKHSIKIMWNCTFTFPSFFVFCYVIKRKVTFPSLNILQLCARDQRATNAMLKF